MKKVIKFFDKHRIILILLILLLITITFLSIKSIIFLNHNFKKLNCTLQIDDTYCYSKKIKIYKDPEKERTNYFQKNKDKIVDLKKEFNLPDFNKYTSYYYEVVALINYEQYKELYNFFEIYNNSYNIEEFYLKNSLYYEIFYSYKII